MDSGIEGGAALLPGLPPPEVPVHHPDLYIVKSEEEKKAKAEKKQQEKEKAEKEKAREPVAASAEEALASPRTRQAQEDAKQARKAKEKEEKERKEAKEKEEKERKEREKREPRTRSYHSASERSWAGGQTRSGPRAGQFPGTS